MTPTPEPKPLDAERQNVVRVNWEAIAINLRDELAACGAMNIEKDATIAALTAELAERGKLLERANGLLGNGLASICWKSDYAALAQQAQGDESCG